MECREYEPRERKEESATVDDGCSECSFAHEMTKCPEISSAKAAKSEKTGKLLVSPVQKVSDYPRVTKVVQQYSTHFRLLFLLSSKREPTQGLRSIASLSHGGALIEVNSTYSHNVHHADTVGNLKGADHSEDSGIDERMVLKLILPGKGRKVRIRLSCLKSCLVSVVPLVPKVAGSNRPRQWIFKGHKSLQHTFLSDGK
jgi:hypothetical protein